MFEIFSDSLIENTKTTKASIPVSKDVDMTANGLSDTKMKGYTHFSQISQLNNSLDSNQFSDYRHFNIEFNNDRTYCSVDELSGSVIFRKCTR